jgi:hypothetical protein
MNIPSTIADYLRRCSQELGERILQVYPALQGPGDPVSDRLNGSSGEFVGQVEPIRCPKTYASGVRKGRNEA